MNQVIQIALYFVFFALSLYGLNAIEFRKLFYTEKTIQAQVLVLLIAMSLAYLSVQFLLGLTFKLN